MKTTCLGCGNCRNIGHCDKERVLLKEGKSYEDVLSAIGYKEMDTHDLEIMNEIFSKPLKLDKADENLDEGYWGIITHEDGGIQMPMGVINDLFDLMEGVDSYE